MYIKFLCYAFFSYFGYVPGPKFAAPFVAGDCQAAWSQHYYLKTMMKQEDYSRREFIKRTSPGLLGAGLALSTTSLVTRSAVAPNIDMHQHTDYHGRTAALLAHQWAMGITTTILLPAPGFRPAGRLKERCYTGTQRNYSGSDGTRGAHTADGGDTEYHIFPTKH